ncbi:hypothetical protein GGI35DRAFT_298493 [Trichoderma velutinum]
MAPKLRAKPNTHARMQRCSTQFNELDVTPNRPEEKTRYLVTNEADAPRVSKSHTHEPFPGDQEQGAIPVDEDVQPTKPFAWSDAGSTANNTRRSSPADLGQLSNDDFWDFEESLAPFSSPSSERNKLPDTIPLASTEQDDQSYIPMNRVDFSETASTIRRSSPFGGTNETRDIWIFDDSSANSSPGPVIPKDMPVLSSDHLPSDELYDFTPKKASVPTQGGGKPSGNQPGVNDDTTNCSSKTTLPSKGKKQRPRAKKPIRFDPLTQEILEEPASKKKKRPAAARLPIVNALKESAKASSSPLAASQKPKPKRTRPQKKAKPEKPPVSETPPTSKVEDVVTFVDSPAQLIAESPSEYLPELPSAGKCGSSKTSLSASSGDDFVAIQEPRQQHRRVPAVIDRRDNNLNDHGTIFPQPYGAKRRRLSRQFSVSERGSPVVVNDAILPESIQPVPVKPHSPMNGHPERLTATQPSSFLRSASSDKTLEQQHASAFGDISGKSSSQWLRRLSDKAPVPRRKPSIGRKLHDEIMKSFLGNTEGEQESSVPEAKPVCAAVPNHVETQIRHTVDQLIARLDDKKKAIFNIVDTYEKSAQGSVLHLKQQCLQDSGSLVHALHNDSGLFGHKLRATTEVIQTHRSARATSTLEMDNSVQGRYQAYSRTRQSLRAFRDEITREKDALV